SIGRHITWPSAPQRAARRSGNPPGNARSVTGRPGVQLRSLFAGLGAFAASPGVWSPPRRSRHEGAPMRVVAFQRAARITVGAAGLRVAALATRPPPAPVTGPPPPAPPPRP